MKKQRTSRCDQIKLITMGTVEFCGRTPRYGVRLYKLTEMKRELHTPEKPSEIVTLPDTW
jgi:hypothetical protein